MKKILRVVSSILIAGFLFLSVTSCMDRAMAPKEEEKKESASPSEPAKK